jgi:hypothetical protein
LSGCKLRHSRKQYSRVPARQFYVVGLATRPIAKGVEIEPGNASGLRSCCYRPAVDLNLRIKPDVARR